MTSVGSDREFFTWFQQIASRQVVRLASQGRPPGAHACHMTPGSCSTRSFYRRGAFTTPIRIPLRRPGLTDLAADGVDYANTCKRHTCFKRRNWRGRRPLHIRGGCCTSGSDFFHFKPNSDALHKKTELLAAHYGQNRLCPLLLCSDSTAEEFFPRTLRNASVLSVAGIWSPSHSLLHVAPSVMHPAPPPQEVVVMWGRGWAGEPTLTHPHPPSPTLTLCPAVAVWQSVLPLLSSDITCWKEHSVETRRGDSAAELLTEVFFPDASRSFSLLPVTSEGKGTQTSVRLSPPLRLSLIC